MTKNKFYTKFADYDMNFLDAVYRVLMLEGGISDDKDDKGGYTKFGISRAFFKINKRKMIEEGIVKESDDVKNLTIEQAVAIYYRFFWMPLKCERLENKFVKSYLFDSGVNMGIGVAVMLLQKAINRVSDSAIVVDGIIGSVTIYEANKLGGKLNLEFVRERVNRYVYISKKRNKVKFLRGWVSRAFAWNDLIEIC